MVYLLMDILERLEWIYPPRYGPEWGSGGIFGLKYYRGVLYYTLAFEAEAYFVYRDGVEVYRFEQVGTLPASGGDTYNAVDAVDDEIFFGGWVHAPAKYKGREKGLRASISFVNKYSHVHRYRVDERRVELLWKESMHDEYRWAGEISEIVYDPVNDRLLLARGDGHSNLGIYQIDRRGGNYKRITNRPAYKGAIFHDHVCFDITDDWIKGVNGIQCIDMVENKAKTLELGDMRKRSIDNEPVQYPVIGAAAQSHGRFFLFVRGGVLIGNPMDESLESISFIRLFDFGESLYAPRRTMAKNIGGGILVAYNAYSEALMYPVNELEERFAKASNTIVGPSTLVYISPPVTKIVAALGARITGIELVEGKILVASNTMANTSRQDASPIDTGYRGFIALDPDIVNNEPPSIRFTIRGYQVGSQVFGGVPLTGYKEPVLTISASKINKLVVYSYDVSLPPTEAEKDSYQLRRGRNAISLKEYGNSIVAFKLSEPDPKAIIRIDLR